MRVKIQITKEFDNLWLAKEDEGKLTDEDFKELIYEDITAFLEDAEFKVIRPTDITACSQDKNK